MIDLATKLEVTFKRVVLRKDVGNTGREISIVDFYRWAMKQDSGRAIDHSCGWENCAIGLYAQEVHKFAREQIDSFVVQQLFKQQGVTSSRVFSSLYGVRFDPTVERTIVEKLGYAEPLTYGELQQLIVEHLGVAV